MNWMEVALFPNLATAEPIKERLVRSGIEAEVHEGLRLEKLWFVPSHGAGARLEVPAESFEVAEQRLLDWDAAEGALRNAIRCPECRSLRVDYPQFTRKSLLTNLALGLSARLGLVEKAYYCHDCHYTWPKEGASPRRSRPNMAPHYFIDGVEQTTLPQPQPTEQKAA
jgi:hypothetical protein